jgi:hypothetical protein
MTPSQEGHMADSRQEDVTILLGAEGVAECAQEPWLRAAKEDEVEAFRSRIGKSFYDALLEDHTGRPYWTVTVLSTAPDWAWNAARGHLRLVRLEP